MAFTGSMQSKQGAWLAVATVTAVQGHAAGAMGRHTVQANGSNLQAGEHFECLASVQDPKVYHPSCVGLIDWQEQQELSSQLDNSIR